MYLPAHFRETSTARLHALMRERPLATLVTASAGDGLAANHLPLLLDAAAGTLGTLRGHVARGNPLWREAQGGLEALAVFHGPQGYVTPGWYATKREHGRVVPTWNYVAVHVRGRLHAIDDRDWLRRLVSDLTAEHEAGSTRPWSVSDAPTDYVDRMLSGIVGIELMITAIEGKWKLGQNQPAANRAGVVAGLARRGTDDDRAMAALIAGGGSEPD